MGCCDTINTPPFLIANELGEKTMELIDETSHVVHRVIRTFASAKVAAFIKSIHEGVHNLEHLWHSTCFINGFYHLVIGDFFNDHLNTIIAKIFHLASNLLAPIMLLAQLGLIVIGECTKFVSVLAAGFSAIGFAIMTIQLIWQKFVEGDVTVAWTDIALHFTGFVYSALSVAWHLIPVTSIALSITQGVVGAISSALSVYKLWNALMSTKNVHTHSDGHAHGH